MNTSEYFKQLGKKSWESRKKTQPANTMSKLGKKGQKSLKKKIALMKEKA